MEGAEDVTMSERKRTAEVLDDGLSSTGSTLSRSDSDARNTDGKNSDLQKLLEAFQTNVQATRSFEAKLDTSMHKVEGRFSPFKLMWAACVSSSRRS